MFAVLHGNVQIGCVCFRESHSDYDDNNDDVAETADSSSDEESEGYVVQNIKALFE